MRLFLYLFFIFFISFSLFAENVSTIRLSYIINNSNEFKDFLNDLDKIRSNYFSELKEEENSFVERKLEIENSKMILDEKEFNKIVNKFNQDTLNYQNKINDYEDYLNDTLDENKKIIISKISEIVGNFSEQNGIELVINEDQYFLSSNKIDISDIILEKLNKESLNLEISNK